MTATLALDKKARHADSLEKLRHKALAVVLDHAPEHTLLVASVAAPCKAWLMSQRRCSGPEIFDVFWATTLHQSSLLAESSSDSAQAKCQALLRLCVRFFRERPKRFETGGRRYRLLTDDDDDDAAEPCYLLVDRRTQPPVEPPARLATHVIAEHDQCYTARFASLRECQRLETVWCPATRTIVPQAFWHCSQLRIAVFPNAEAVGAYAFGGCQNLQALAIPTVVCIQDYAFFHCSSLTVLALKAAAFVGDYACARCSKLQHVFLHSHSCVRPTTFVGGIGKLHIRRLPFPTSL